MKKATEIFLEYCEERDWEPYPEEDPRRASIIAMIKRTQEDATAHLKQDVVLISDGDCRHALYINGKLIEDGPDTGVHSVLEHYGIEWKYPNANEDWLDEVLYETGIWPKALKDVEID